METLSEVPSGRSVASPLVWWDSGYGIAVAFGAASGGLASRDFDEVESYERWATNHAGLAQWLPTVETSRGFHVYFRMGAKELSTLRAMLGKKRNTGAISLGDGELRADVGCYSVLPPSTHPSGHVYRWMIPLPSNRLPLIDPILSGLADFSPSANVAYEDENVAQEGIG